METSYPQSPGLTLNEELANRGFTTRPSVHGRKDILCNGEVVLSRASAGDVEDWLNGMDTTEEGEDSSK